MGVGQKGAPETGDFCPGARGGKWPGKGGPAAILINAYSGDFCHPVLWDAVLAEPLVYHSGTEMAILGHFGGSPKNPLFWPFLAKNPLFAIFGRFSRILPIFPQKFPQTRPKNFPPEKNSRTPWRKFSAQKLFPDTSAKFLSAQNVQNAKCAKCTNAQMHKCTNAEM